MQLDTLNSIINIYSVLATGQVLFLEMEIKMMKGIIHIYFYKAQDFIHVTLQKTSINFFLTAQPVRKTSRLECY